MPQITKHAKKRMKQRTGITQGTLGKFTRRVFQHGLKYEDTTSGELRWWMAKRRQRHPNADNVRYYQGKLYIFAKDTLITVIDAPPYIEEHLEEYVEQHAYLRYSNYLLARKRNKKKQSAEQPAATEEAPRYIKRVPSIDDNVRLEQITMPIGQSTEEESIMGNIRSIALKAFPNISIVKVEATGENQLKITYVSDALYFDGIQYTDLKEYVQEKYGKKTTLTKLTDENGKYITTEAWRKAH